MRVLVLALMLLSTTICSAGLGKLPKWVWWTPPKTLSKADRLGYSSDQILSMGKKRFYKAADEVLSKSEKRGHSPSSDMVFGDGPCIVFGWCESDRNDRLLKTKPRKARIVLRALRDELFMFGMACIAIETSLAGGGTYQIHEPRYYYERNERLFYRLLTRPPQTNFVHNLKVGMRLRLHELRQLNLPKGQFGVCGEVRLSDVHRFTKIAIARYNSINRLLSSLDRRSSQAISMFMKESLF
jgi:hypothetical protein